MRCDLQEGLPAISSLRKRLEIALDVARALQYLHAENLFHRDVKVQNVLVSLWIPVLNCLKQKVLKLKTRKQFKPNE